MAKAMDCTLGLLARREHAASELTVKLRKKGYDQQEITEVLMECQRLGLQSDERFAESLCRVRIRQGYGPLRIMQELQAAKLDKELITRICNQERDNWESYALAAKAKKFKTTGLTRMEIQKQQRFLLYRGFPAELVNKIYTHPDIVEDYEKLGN